MSEQIWWYTARSGGIVAMGLLTASVVWGLLFSTRMIKGRSTPKWLMSLHRHLGALSVIFTGVHVAGLVADSYVHFGISEVFVPFASSWQPGAVAWGVIGMYLLVAVEITSLLMKRIPRRFWKAIHMSSYALFWMAIVHGALAGTDASSAAYVAFEVGAVLLVVFLTGYRVLTSRKMRQAGASRPTSSATVPGVRASASEAV